MLGREAGLTSEAIYQVIGRGVGASRMFEVPGPMMVGGSYDQARMKIEVPQRDPRSLAISPASCLSDAPVRHLGTALCNRRRPRVGPRTRAAVCVMLEEMAGLKRSQHV